MEKKYILSIDCGSQSIKALLFDNRGEMVAKEQHVFEGYEHPNPNWAERDPDIFWRASAMSPRQSRRIISIFSVK